jgi:uncharacterized membrane protein
MQPTVAGLFVGLILGLALVFGDFGEMLIVALFGAIGFVVMMVIQGDLDLDDFLARRQQRRRR